MSTLLVARQLQVRFRGVLPYALFIDFKRAFDSVSHDNLWIKLRCLDLSSKILSIIMDIYSSTCMQVKSNGELTEPIDITMEVLQGEVLSPRLS